MTTEQIYQQMASEAMQQAALVGLAPNPDSAAQLQADMASGSRVAIHRLLMRIVAYVTKLHHDLWERFRVETEDLAKDGHYGTRRWFVSRARRFQYGHPIVLTELDAVYAVDDPASRIVTHAAVVELANLVVVRAAKAAGTGLAPLSPDERTALADYFDEIRPPVQVTVLTAPADRVRVYGQVVYDGQVPLTTVQAAMAFEVAQYLRTLDFGGAVRNTDLVGAMLRANGVVDVRMVTVQVRTTGPWVTVPRIHYTYAGHAVIDSAFPLTTSMTWQVGTL